jgi:hypothetical protein
VTEGGEAVDDGYGSCLNCGYRVDLRALICPRCRANPRVAPVPVEAPPAIPSSEPHAQATTSVGVDLVIHLPGFVEIPVPVGATVEIGRDSPDDRVFDALVPFVDVSREHVLLRNNRDGAVLHNLATVAGRTWVDGIEVPLGDAVPFPVHAGQRIRLGSACYLKLETE